jgi:simple sugar transport system ATP-binding protein
MIMSDRITVIRRGEKIKTLYKEDTDTDHLAELMVGRKVNLVANKNAKEPGETILEVTDLEAVNNRDIPALKGISFEVKKGEIFAIAGVDGNGQTELVEVLTGLRAATGGKILFRGENISKLSTDNRIKKGVSHIPEDRHKRGLVLEHTLAENSILGHHKTKPFSEKGFMNYDEIRAYCREMIEEFDVRTPNELVEAKSLSGGNQQKLIVARELIRKPELLIASQPTRGVDVGAIEFIHEKLLEERENNKAVLLVSLELDEVLALADRIGVIYDGQLVGIVDADETDERELGIMMAGGQSDQDKKQGVKQ